MSYHGFAPHRLHSYDPSVLVKLGRAQRSVAGLRRSHNEDRSQEVVSFHGSPAGMLASASLACRTCSAMRSAQLHLPVPYFASCVLLYCTYILAHSTIEAGFRSTAITVHHFLRAVCLRIALSDSHRAAFFPLSQRAPSSVPVCCAGVSPSFPAQYLGVEVVGFWLWQDCVADAAKQAFLQSLGANSTCAGEASFHPRVLEGGATDYRISCRARRFGRGGGNNRTDTACMRTTNWEGARQVMHSVSYYMLLLSSYYILPATIRHQSVSMRNNSAARLATFFMSVRIGALAFIWSIAIESRTARSME